MTALTLNEGVNDAPPAKSERTVAPSSLRKFTLPVTLAVGSLITMPGCQFPVVAPRPGQAKAESAAQDNAAQQTEKETEAPAYAVFQERDRAAFAAEAPVALSAQDDGELAVGEEPIYLIVQNENGEMRKVREIYVEENGRQLLRVGNRLFVMRYEKLEGLGAGNISDVRVKSMEKRTEKNGEEEVVMLSIGVKVTFLRLHPSSSMDMSLSQLEQIAAQLADSKAVFESGKEYAGFEIDGGARRVWFEYVGEVEQAQGK